MIPRYVDCNKCLNKESIFCMSCKVKYQTAPYLNFISIQCYKTNNSTGGNDNGRFNKM